MSKIGKLPIKLPASTTLTVADNHVTVVGPLGTLDWQLPLGVTVQQADGTVLVVNAHPEDRMTRPAHGLARARLANMVKGVSVGFERILDIAGVGFRVEVHEPEVWLHVGLSHPVKLAIIPGVSIKVVKNEKYAKDQANKSSNADRVGGSCNYYWYFGQHCPAAIYQKP